MWQQCILGILVLAFFAPASANAASYYFGHREEIHKLVDVDLEGPAGEKLFLGHKTSMYFLVAGVYAKSDGYVLGVRGESKSYFDMPTGEKLARFQSQGSLPQQLPEYSLTIMDWLIGYSLWIIILCIVLFELGKRKMAEVRTLRAKTV